jgi:hypothetical protein
MPAGECVPLLRVGRSCVLKVQRRGPSPALASNLGRVALAQPISRLPLVLSAAANISLVISKARCSFPPLTALGAESGDAATANSTVRLRSVMPFAQAGAPLFMQEQGRCIRVGSGFQFVPHPRVAGLSSDQTRLLGSGSGSGHGQTHGIDGLAKTRKPGKPGPRVSASPNPPLLLSLAPRDDPSRQPLETTPRDGTCTRPFKTAPWDGASRRPLETALEDGHSKRIGPRRGREPTTI